MKQALLAIFLLFTFIGHATDYHVGPTQTYTTISSIAWESIQPGDQVFIHWRSTPYKEKWVINVQATATNPFKLIGVLGPNGERPIIDGNGASTRTQLDYWGEERGVIKIGGSSIPADGLPSHIIIENLEFTSAYQSYQFSDDNGQTKTFTKNAAAIYVEKAANLVIRNCVMTNSGNGLFIGPFNGQSANILIEKNHIFGNGVVNSAYEHNSYTEALGITFQYNHYGPLRNGADGNNLKDRSAGLVVRYNWIESGNRQLDLVDAEGSSTIVNDPSYHTTHVYGNILIEPNGAGNSQIVHYGGDSGTTADYRKGDLYFYNNTIISTRTGFTTLMRLSTGDETAHVFNNIIYTTAPGSNFAMTNDDGTINMHHNWLKTGWVISHGTPTGTVNDLGNNITGATPSFTDFNNQDFSLQNNSAAINQGDIIPSTLPLVDMEYVKHQAGQNKNIIGNIDIGAYESAVPLAVELSDFNIQLSQNKNAILLRWQTQQEINNDGFNVQKQTGFNAWETIGWIKGKGNTNNSQTYQFLDKTPTVGENTYRLEQIDLDGTIEYSNIRSIFFRQYIQKITLSPNPATNILNVDSERPFKHYTIVNYLGQKIQYGSLKNNTVDISALGKGKFILILLNRDSQESIVFTKY